MHPQVLTYDIDEVVPYINWLYFYHAWGMSGKPLAEKQRLRDEASAMMQSWQGRYHTHAVFALYSANADMDDLLFYADDTADARFTRIPLLRQQHPVAAGSPNLSMMSQVLSDRLAEATVEKMHLEVRRHFWGYAPHEHLTMEQLHREEYQGIRPAVGYPSLPDVSVNFELDQLLTMSQIGIRLTESGMMMPHSSVSGLMFAHPQAHYFDLGKIDEEQLRDYARRRGIPVELMRRYLQSSLIKK